MAGKTKRPDATIDLWDAPAAHPDSALRQFPEQGRFPLNEEHRRVSQAVVPDLLQGDAALIIAGYASLDRLIQYCGEMSAHHQLRVLFGHEPFPGQRRDYTLDDRALPAEVAEYWASEQVSLIHSAALIRMIDLLESGRVQARHAPSGRIMHAKIYVGEHAATVGSSNFTAPGLDGQTEANARFDRNRESKRYAQLRDIAENYWALGRDYNADLIALLRELLQFVTWQEALARACAELLEGEWAAAYLDGGFLSQADGLWPSQRQGIAQALAVLADQGSVLIADATGAGKTRMGAYLIGAIRDDILRRGRLWQRGGTLMICPPSVIESWEREKLAAGVPMEVYSQGGISHSGSRMHPIKVEALRKAQVLCLDEGHNFLNSNSKRTQLVLRNMADHVVVLTATPINRGVRDLMSIVNVLGADNLDDSTIQAFERLMRSRDPAATLADNELVELRGQLRKFTVRRTKSMLNRLIDREPDAYTDQAGRRCRFPRHAPKVYALDEPEADRVAAAQIRELAAQLQAVTYFQKPIERPEVARRQGVSEEAYLQGRLDGARKLAGYQVVAALRSSRAALIEHIEGARVAADFAGLEATSKKQDAGDMLRRLEEVAGRVPVNKLSIDLPDWLVEPEAHRRAAAADAAIYQRIAALTRAMSIHREKRKAAVVVARADHHGLVLAFDSRPITLAVIRKLIARSRFKTLLVTGEATADRAKLLTAFAPTGEATGLVGLCSDSMSEGVNLQRASALVHLDMPSVVRIAEQRAGRVDRLDTTHEAVEVWWPDDAPEFAVSADERFVQRLETVESLLGSNMPLPEHMRDETFQPVSAQTMIEEYEASAAAPWDGIDDAFQPARALVEGPDALVDAATYEQYRRVTARVLSRVSLVESRAPWAFFCVTGGSFDAPRWLLLPGYTATPVTALAEVVDGLRERLTPDTRSLDDPHAGVAELQRFIQQLVRVERSLLSRRKRRALELLEACLNTLINRASARHDQSALDPLHRLQRHLRRPDPDRQPDWDALATRWLDVIRPMWFSELEADRRRKKPLLLADLKPRLLAADANLEQLILEHFQRIPGSRSLGKRIRACIIGVPR